jgi:hypothetical protein
MVSGVGWANVKLPPTDWQKAVQRVAVSSAVAPGSTMPHSSGSPPPGALHAQQARCGQVSRFGHFLHFFLRFFAAAKRCVPSAVAPVSSPAYACRRPVPAIVRVTWSMSTADPFSAHLAGNQPLVSPKCRAWRQRLAWVGRKTHTDDLVAAGTQAAIDLPSGLW